MSSYERELMAAAGDDPLTPTELINAVIENRSNQEQRGEINASLWQLVDDNKLIWQKDGRIRKA